MALGGMIGAGMQFVIFAMLMGLGAIVLAEFKNQTDDTSAETIIDNGVTSITTLSSWQDLIATVVAAVIVIVLVLKSIGGLGGIGGGGSGE